MKESKEFNKECSGCCKEGKECEHQCGGCCRKEHILEYGSCQGKTRAETIAMLSELNPLAEPLSQIIGTLGDTYEERLEILGEQVDKRSDLMVSFVNMMTGADGIAAAEIVLMATAKVLNDAVVQTMSRGRSNPHNERYVMAQAKRHLDYYYAQRIEGYEDMEIDGRPLLPLKELARIFGKEAE